MQRGQHTCNSTHQHCRGYFWHLAMEVGNGHYRHWVTCAIGIMARAHCSLVQLRELLHHLAAGNGASVAALVVAQGSW